MTREEAWLRVAPECPRRILAVLHRRGEYRHGTTPRFPGKVLCCHESAALPEGWTPTVAQEQAWAASRLAVQRPHGPLGQPVAGPGLGEPNGAPVEHHP
jgi:hypothetical protein